MRSIEDKPVFVNSVVTYGVTNGVVNLDLATLLFNPGKEGPSVEAEMVISCRLRMDENCARQIVANLTQQIEHIERHRNSAAVTAAAAQDGVGAKPN